MKKVVGVIPLYDEIRECCWMLPGYLKMLEEQGAVPVILPLTIDQEELDFFLESCQGFLLTGGQDVSPEIYHEKLTENRGAVCKERDEMEAYVLKEAVQRNLSTLGICRGLQFMNACYGGTLYQDLPTERPGGIDHHMAPPYDRIAHRVDILAGTPLFDVLGKKRIGVNSYHHQAIRRLSEKFRPMAYSEDGLVEAIYMPEHRFVAGVQWHPEFSYKKDENSARLIKAFADSL